MITIGIRFRCIFMLTNDVKIQHFYGLEVYLKSSTEQYEFEMFYRI